MEGPGLPTVSYTLSLYCLSVSLWPSGFPPHTRPQPSWYFVAEEMMPMEIPCADQIASCELGGGRTAYRSGGNSQKRGGEMQQGHALVKVALAGTEDSGMQSHGEKFICP